MSCSCSGGVKLLFACSGASDVGEIADRTARRLSREGAGKMFCLTGIGGGVESILKITKAADRIVAIDGCAQLCAKHCLEKAGITDFAHMQLGALGMEKGNAPVSGERIAAAAEAAGALLSCG